MLLLLLLLLILLLHQLLHPLLPLLCTAKNLYPKCHLSVNGAICDGMTQSIYTYMHRGSGRTAAAAGAVGRPAGEDADSTT